MHLWGCQRNFTFHFHLSFDHILPHETLYCHHCTQINTHLNALKYTKYTLLIFLYQLQWISGHNNICINQMTINISFLTNVDVEVRRSRHFTHHTHAQLAICPNHLSGEAVAVCFYHCGTLEETWAENCTVVVLVRLM